MTHTDRFRNYLNRRRAMGWTHLILQDGSNEYDDEQERKSWLLEHAGLSVNGDDFSCTDPLGEAWEDLGGGQPEYLIKDAKVAVLFKLVFGGQ